MRGERAHIAALLVVALLSLVAFHRTYLGGELILADDTLRTSVPFLEWFFRTARGGELPQWWPGLLTGYPMTSSVEMHLFTPFHAHFYWMDTPLAVALKQWAAYGTMGVGTYLLARRWGSSPVGGAGAALCFSLGNHAMFLQIEPSGLVTLPWFPWVLWAWDHGMHQPRGRGMVAAGLLVGFAMLGGYLQHVYALATLVLLLSVSMSWDRAEPGQRLRFLGQRIPGAALLCLLALGIFAITWMPTLALVQDSVRSGMSTLGRLQDSPRAVSLIGLLSIEASPHRTVTFDYGAIGLLPLMLAGIAAVMPSSTSGTRWRPSERTLMWMALGYLFVSFGALTPVSALIVRALPLYPFQEPHRIAVVYSLLVALLAGRGVDALLREPVEQVRQRVRRCLLWAIPGVLIAGLLAAGQLRHVWSGPGGPALTRELLLLGAGMLLLGMGLWSARWRQLRWPATIAVLGIVLAISADFGRRYLEHERFRAPSHRFRVGLWESRPAGRPWREAGGTGRTMPPRFMTSVPARDEGGPARMVPVIGDDAVATHGALLAGLESPLATISLRPRRLVRLLFGRWEVPGDDAHTPGLGPHISQRTLDVLGVHYLAGADEAPARAVAGPHLELDRWARESRGGASIWTSSTAVPRCLVVASARWAENEAEALRWILEPSTDLRRVVILEQPAPSQPGQPGREPGDPRCTVVERSANRVTVTLRDVTGGWLVLQERFADGWRAQVDGESRPVRRADYLYRAVPLRPGDRTVVFDYAQPWFRTGAWVSVLCAVFAFGWIGFRTWWRRAPGYGEQGP